MLVFRGLTISHSVFVSKGKSFHPSKNPQSQTVKGCKTEAQNSLAREIALELLQKTGDDVMKPDFLSLE